MSSVEYVEYQASYAKAISDMWNRSSDGWMGRDFNSSEAKVLDAEGNGGYINLYLAVEGNLVLGYAKLAKYREEPGVAYIELLSVDPAYHGRGIGRDLVRMCVLRAAELGFSRLDLFTWAGNTKAVPLYKKCGFFWEKLESQATHLMNFIPGILNNEWLKPWFEYFDWYTDTKRLLDIEPDGRRENGFDYLDYVWEKDGKKLEISFERGGRGITAIRTPDISIAVDVTAAKPVFGDNYPVKYRIENFSGKPLDLELRGVHDGIVRFDHISRHTVTEALDISADFYLEALTQDLSEWETYPCVITDLMLDGKLIQLKTGLHVQYPLTVNLRNHSSVVTPGAITPLYLNVRNEYSFPCDYEITFPEHERVSMDTHTYHVSLQGEESSYLEIPIRVLGAVVFNPELSIVARPQGAKEIRFSTSSYIYLYCPDSANEAITKDLATIINGLVSFWFSSKQGKNWCGLNSNFGQSINFMPPQIGKPYTEEFEHQAPQEIKVLNLGYANQMTVSFASKETPGVAFSYLITLYPSGMLEFGLKVNALPEDGKDYHLMITRSGEGSGLQYEMDGRVYEFDADMPDTDVCDLNGKTLSGNWIFRRTDDAFEACIWNPLAPARVFRYWLCWEVDLRMWAQQADPAEPVFRMYMDVFRNCWQVRNHALNERKRVQQVHPSLELIVNDSNPIITGPHSVHLQHHINYILRGSARLIDDTGRVYGNEVILSREDAVKEIDWHINDVPEHGCLRYTCDAMILGKHILRSQTVFRSRGAVEFSDVEGLLGADNGAIRIGMRSDACLPGLTSIIYNGKEWLDSGYPDFGPKSFFNPYQGGLSVVPTRVNPKDLMRETHISGTVRFKDQFSNIWEGLCVETTVMQTTSSKGLRFRQCYVVHPGCPVLVVLTELVQGTGWAQFIQFRMNCSFRHSEAGDQGTIYWPLPHGSRLEMLSAEDELGVRDYAAQIGYRMSAADTTMQIVHVSRVGHAIHMDQHIVRDVSNLYSEIRVPEHDWLTPQFILFSKNMIDQKDLGHLISLSFTEIID